MSRACAAVLTAGGESNDETGDDKGGDEQRVYRVGRPTL